MPSPDTLRRLSALESLGTKRTGSDPARIHQTMIDLGLESPEPLPGEDSQTWLTRVSTASLEAVLEYRERLNV